MDQKGPVAGADPGSAQFGEEFDYTALDAKQVSK